MRALCLVLVACGGSPAGDPDGGFPGPPDGAGGAPWSEDYVRSDHYRRLVLEIDSVPGFEPRAQVETDLVAGLEPLLDKPDGIATVRDGVLTSRGTDHAWTFGELDTLARQTFTLAVPAGTVKMHVLFVDGHWAEDSASSRVLGIAWGGSHLVMFKQTIEDVCAGAPLLIRERVCTLAELGIWTHETGHLLGLVDNGLPMVTPHKDATHGAHDVSDQCIMYWAYQGQDMITLISDRILAGNDEGLGFDAACLADLAAVRNR
jgi:hypothetical protein